MLTFGAGVVRSGLEVPGKSGGMGYILVNCGCASVSLKIFPQKSPTMAEQVNTISAGDHIAFFSTELQTTTFAKGGVSLSSSLQFFYPLPKVEKEGDGYLIGIGEFKMEEQIEQPDQNDPTNKYKTVRATWECPNYDSATSKKSTIAFNTILWSDDKYQSEQLNKNYRAGDTARIVVHMTWLDPENKELTAKPLNFIRRQAISQQTGTPVKQVGTPAFFSRQRSSPAEGPSTPTKKPKLQK